MERSGGDVQRYACGKGFRFSDGNASEVFCVHERSYESEAFLRDFLAFGRADHGRRSYDVD